MRRLRNIVIAGLAGAGFAFAALSAQATTVQCGITPNNGVLPTVVVDPFNPGGAASNTTFNLVLTRVINVQRKTQIVNFYFVQPTSTGITISNAGSSVLYTETNPPAPGPDTPPTLNTNSQVAGAVNVNFGGTAQPDQTSVTLQISIPANTDLSAGTNLTFGIVFECKATGGQNPADVSDVTTPTYKPSVITLPVYVLNALQANYAGPALDFGDITTLPNGGPFPTKSGMVDVASSGPYEVTMTSTNGFQMTAAGSATPVPYSVSFMGQTPVDGTHAFAEMDCQKAGIPAAGFPISATLETGGVGKHSGAYSDTINITFTPLNATDGPGPCA